jgi:hypothetical protein
MCDITVGFNIPMFNNEPPHELQQCQVGSAKDHDRHAAGIIFRDALGTYLCSLVFTLTNHSNIVLFLLMYSSLKIHLPWKRWLELAWRECLCMIG